MKRRDKATTDRVGALRVEVTVELPKGRRGPPTDLGCGKEPANTAVHIPRITRLMALAIKFQEMVDCGEVRDYADIARLGYVTRARLTQIMNLLLLAPDIQEALLHSGAKLEKPLSERHIRSIAAVESWESQRAAMVRLGCRGDERDM
jgi:hypothetical protein